MVLGLLVGLAVFGAGVPSTAADGGPEPGAAIQEENVSGFYAGERVEGFDQVNAIQPTPDGGVIALESSGGESIETRILRFDGTGTVVHEETTTEYLDSVTRVGDDAYAAVGFRDGDVLVAWINEDGTVEWTETFGGDETDIAFDVVSAPDGDAYVLASTESFGVETSDLWVLRVDADGEVVWERRVEHEKWTAFPKGERLQDGSLIATIRTERSMDKEVDGNQNVSVARIAPDGTIEWRTVVSGYGEPASKDEMYEVLPAHGEGVLIVGTSNTGKERWNPDFWAARVDDGGVVLWQNQYDAETNDLASSAVRTSNGYLLAGAAQDGEGNSTGKLIAIGEDGRERFRTTYRRHPDLNERVVGMDWTADGRLLIAGATIKRTEDGMRSQAWILEHGDVASQVEPGPSTWETQHPNRDESDGGSDDDATDGDGANDRDGANDGDGASNDDGASDGADTQATRTTADVEPSSMDAVLYGATAVTVAALFVPYGLRRFRRR